VAPAPTTRKTRAVRPCVESATFSAQPLLPPAPPGRSQVPPPRPRPTRHRALRGMCGMCGRVIETVKSEERSFVHRLSVGSRLSLQLSIIVEAASQTRWHRHTGRDSLALTRVCIIPQCLTLPPPTRSRQPPSPPHSSSRREPGTHTGDSAAVPRKLTPPRAPATAPRYRPVSRPQIALSRPPAGPRIQLRRGPPHPQRRWRRRP